MISDLEFGGAQRQVVELANHTDPAVCDIKICSLSSYAPLAKKIERAGGQLRFILRRFRFDFTVVPRLAALLRRVNADVVHSFLFDATIASRLAGRLAGRPAVIGSERNTNYKLKRSNFIALKATQRCSHLTIANSRAGADFNSRLFGQPKNRYRVVHNGVDVQRFRPRDGIETRQKLGLSARQPVVGMFASFKPQKNHLLWLRAARQVIQRVPDVKFVFVGDELYKGMSDSTEFKKTINRTVDEMGLRQHCLFVGNRTDVENYYPVCSVTVLPSLFEGTPNVALESMACGVPVIASNVSDNAYIVPDGKVGYVVGLNDENALADRVSRILLDRALGVEMSTNARVWVSSEFSCPRLAEKTVSVYREAVDLRLGDGLGPMPSKSETLAS